MTVDHGGVELFEAKAAALGEDPLRADADAEALWSRVSKSSKSIGSLLMDQAYFAGVGNIFRAEILLVAGVHPEVKGERLSREQFERIWAASVRLMGKAFTLGSIVTVEPSEAAAVGRAGLRRWVYNSARCGKCAGPVRSWDIQGRTCYACERCQPKTAGAEAPSDAAPPVLFNSHCASETLQERLATPQKLRVAELRAALEASGLPTVGKKAELVERLTAHLDQSASTDAEEGRLAAVASTSDDEHARGAVIRSARAAAADKVAAKESRAVEHVAEYEDVDDGAPEWVAFTPVQGQASGEGEPKSQGKEGLATQKRKPLSMETAVRTKRKRRKV